MNNISKEKIEEKLRLFEVVAFGCHERAHRKLSNFFRKECDGIETYLFVEYFCSNPIPREDAASAWKRTLVFYPFIRRLVHDNQFIWVWNRGSFRLQPKDQLLMSRFEDASRFWLPSTALGIGPKVLQWWKSHNVLSKRPAFEVRSNDGIKIDSVVSYWKDKNWEEYLEFIKKQTGEAKKVLLDEYGLTVKPWEVGKKTALLFVYPIATTSIFYGYFILIVQPPKQKSSNGRKFHYDVWRKLNEISHSTYIPVLTVLAESLLEEELEAKIRANLEDKKKKKNWKSIATKFMTIEKIPFLHCAESTKNDMKKGKCLRCEDEPEEGHKLECKHTYCPTRRHPYSAGIERSLHRLWVRRMHLLESLVQDEPGEVRFLDSLPLAKYFVASPGLMSQIELVMTTEIRTPRERESLQAALVYGGPGSGKDVVARLIPLFSGSYFYRRIHVLNMAAIRPDAFTGPLLQGIRLTSQDENNLNYRMLGLEGLLLKAKRETIIEEEENHSKNAATFILDELNSLDIELQGILLRILEQGEVMPLFGLWKDCIQHLVIGIVNENPDEISREGDLRDLLTEKGKLGTLINGFIYEMLRRTRRLREDLYHRLKRQLYVRIPELADRPEDIPMLFYRFVRVEAKTAANISNLIVTMNVYKLLMDPRYSWPGNVRQVQAVARNSFKNAYSDDSGKRGILTIRRQHVLSALKTEFKDIMPDGSD